MALEFIGSTQKVKAKKAHVCSYCECSIEVGETYKRSTLKYDFIYTWKEHIRCGIIADKLNMFDDCDGYGLTGEDFQEYIKYAFIDIWREKDNDHYESKAFVFPNFKEQLDFVCQHHLNRANDGSGTPQTEGRGVQADSVLKRPNNHPF